MGYKLFWGQWILQSQTLAQKTNKDAGLTLFFISHSFSQYLGYITFDATSQTLLLPYPKLSLVIE
jgi:hypothetical protein